ncbi:hypothetical protein CCS92_34015, partial [Methylobacterium radiotolerans]
MLLTLAEAVVLVFVVMFLFLQNFRYPLIPTLVVPRPLLAPRSQARPAGHTRPRPGRPPGGRG